MQNTLPGFGGAAHIDAAMIGLTLNAYYLSTTLRTMLRHGEAFLSARMIFIFHHPHHFGDHVSPALDHDPVTDLHAQSLDLILVMQGGAGDGGAADENRCERGYRRELSGAAHLHQDVLNPGNAGARRVFIGNRPARRFAGEAQLVLNGSVVNLDDNAVNLVRQGIALLLPLADEAQHLF